MVFWFILFMGLIKCLFFIWLFFIFFMLVGLVFFDNCEFYFVFMFLLVDIEVVGFEGRWLSCVIGDVVGR